MKRFFILALFSLFFLSCASNKPARPAFRSNCDITFVNNNALVAASYSGKDWVFIEGVEFKASNGDTFRVMFRPQDLKQKVYNDASVWEYGSLWLHEKRAEPIKNGEPYEARIIARDKIFDFQPLPVKFSNN